MTNSLKTSTTELWSFPGETLAFLKDLKQNNKREWFAQNKTVYDQAIKFPAEQFCSQMTAGLATFTGYPHTSKIFRIHRDVRFSKDKTPYNTHLHISFFPQSSSPASPAWYFGLDANRLTLGAGLLGFDKSYLDTYRNRVAGPLGKNLADILCKFAGEGIRVSEPELKRVPSPFEKDHEFAINLRRKSLAVWIDQDDPNVVTEGNISQNCLTAYGQLKPLVDWLR